MESHSDSKEKRMNKNFLISKICFNVTMLIAILVIALGQFLSFSQVEANSEITYVIRFQFEDFENLPQEIQTLLPEEVTTSDRMTYLLYNFYNDKMPKLSTVVDKEENFWQPGQWQSVEKNVNQLTTRTFKTTWNKVAPKKAEYLVGEHDEMSEEIKAQIREMLPKGVTVPANKVQEQPQSLSSLKDETNRIYWKFKSWLINEEEDKVSYTALWEKRFLGKVSYRFAEHEKMSEQVKEMIHTLLPEPVYVGEGEEIPLPVIEPYRDEEKNEVWRLTWERTSGVKNEDLEVLGTWQVKERTYKGRVNFLYNQNLSSRQITNYTGVTVEYENGSDILDKDGVLSKAIEAVRPNFQSGWASIYFMGWSNVFNFDGSQEGGRGFYGNMTVEEAFPNGLTDMNILFAFYFNGPDYIVHEKKFQGDLTINPDRKTNLAVDGNAVPFSLTYRLNEYNWNVIRRGNWQEEGSSEYYSSTDRVNVEGGSTKKNIADMEKEERYSFVDFVIDLDERVKMAKELELDFHSYVLKPHFIMDADYQKLDADIQVENDNPKSKIKVLSPKSNKIIIRSRIRFSKETPNIGYDEIGKDLRIVSAKADNFKVSNQVRREIAEKKADKLSIRVSLEGGLRLYSNTKAVIAKQEAKPYLVDFTKPLDESPLLPYTPEIAEKGKEEILENSEIPLSSLETVKNLPFEDVTEKHWFYQEVAKLYEEKFMLGISEKEFRPNGLVSRAMLPTVLYRMAKADKVDMTKKIRDIERGAWYEEAIYWAREKGLMQGDNEGYFMPMKNISRQDFIVILYRYGKELPASEKKADLKFTDESEIADYAKEAVFWAVQNNLLKGNDERKVNPKAMLSRAEMAAILSRFLEQIK